ncbi:g5633 [Coccomyxa viridis]|uniref:G5633 protein n=1 Tax=Coccomyxa viridis TaxID=1274662 RepID=A0ABP1FYE5_9CHLO
MRLPTPCARLGQIPLAYQWCRRHLRAPTTLTPMSMSYDGTSMGLKHKELHKEQETTSSSASAAQAPKPQLSNFCRKCGGTISMRRPPSENELRHVCDACGYVDYYNPKLVVGCIVEHEGRILLCRRAIEPCKGLWTVPAGFLEMGESTAAGAARETWEEANARVEIMAPYAHWDIPVIGQGYLLFRARLAAPHSFSPGIESIETELFEPKDIPFDKVAFSSISTALRLYTSDLAEGHFHIHHGVIVKKAGAPPNDPAAFQLMDHFAIPTSISSRL